VCLGGVYDPDESSTFNFVSDDFNISYVDGSFAIGDYVTDTIRLGGVEIPDFQFGTGSQSTSPRMFYLLTKRRDFLGWRLTTDD
jgi:hypothetical protein